MDNLKLIHIEIAYAEPLKSYLIPLQVAEGTTLEQAIIASTILNLCPQIDLKKQKVGIFSKQKKLSDILNEGDRVEIYRPLLIDPKEARRKRARRF